MKHATTLQINALDDASGATWRLLRANKHLRVEFTGAGRTVVLSIANSPSDQRALANVAGDLRRAFRRWVGYLEVNSLISNYALLRFAIVHNG